MGTVTARVADSTGHTAAASAGYTVDARRMPLGASNVDNAAELAAYEQRFGRLHVRRSYNQPEDGIPATWAASAAGADVGRRTSVYSCKPDIKALAARQAAVMARARGFFASIPVDGYGKVLILWHEPESEIKQGLFSPVQFYTALVVWDELVRDTGRPDLAAGICFAGTQCFDGQTMRRYGWDADDLAPPKILACFDAYNTYDGQDPADWRELPVRFGRQAQWANQTGRRWGISETGCYEWRTGTTSGGGPVYDPAHKVAWTTSGLAWARAQGAEFVCWWDNAFTADADKNARRLHSSPQHIAAWRALNTT